MDTIKVEDKYFAPFFERIPLSIVKGEGVYVWDEKGKKYMDFTAGWGVTSIGHANPIIKEALCRQADKIIQGPEAGLTYSPERAKLLDLLHKILPKGLDKIFFTNSGAEANDAVIKLARKASGKMNVISTFKSFHGRTISTASATGQSIHRDKYNPLMPNYIFVPFNDIDDLYKEIKNNVAAVILEPIQGEGGINIPYGNYLEKVSEICRKNKVFLIVDEIQTGICRTGRMFASDLKKVNVDFLTVAKGIAGGYPFGAFAMTKKAADKLEIGDHGGTFCGNPLGCAVSYAVLKYMIDNNIEKNVNDVGEYTLNILKEWKNNYPSLISDVRGKGLLIGLQFHQKEIASKIKDTSLKKGLILNLKQGNIIRIFPALNITLDEMKQGLSILDDVIDGVFRSI